MNIRKIATNALISFSLMSSFLVGATETIALTSGNWPPYLSSDLPGGGIAARIVTKAFNTVGVDVTYGHFPWLRSLSYAKWGADNYGNVWHGSLLWIETEDRKKDFYYSDPVIVDEAVLFYHRDRAFDWHTLSDLNGKTIATTNHTVYPALEGLANQGALILNRAGSYDVVLQRVLHRKTLDAAVLLKRVGIYYLEAMSKQGIAHYISFSPRPVQTRKYHLMLSKNVPGNKELVERFNQGLKSLFSSPDYQPLKRELMKGPPNNLLSD